MSLPALHQFRQHGSWIIKSEDRVYEIQKTKLGNLGRIQYYAYKNRKKVAGPCDTAAQAWQGFADAEAGDAQQAAA